MNSMINDRNNARNKNEFLSSWTKMQIKKE